MFSSLAQITGLSGDVLIIGTLFVILFAAALYFGKGRMLSFILSFFPATLLYSSFPYTSKLIFLKGEGLVTVNKLALFLLFFVPLNLIIYRFLFHTSEYGRGGKFLGALAAAVSALILLIIFTYSTVSFNAFYDFSSQIDALCQGPGKVFWWYLASALLLAVL